MAIITGTTTSYNISSGGGNREGLEDVIWDLFAEESWALTNLDKVEATSVYHEWLEDTLSSPASNRVVEGNEPTYAAVSAPVRKGNYCQISEKVFLISRTQEKIAKAGRRSEIQRYAMKYMRELKNDMEYALVTNQASSAGGSATARSSAGMESWIASNATKATTTASAATTGFTNGAVAAPTDGSTTGAVSETTFKSALQAAWDDGGRPTVILVGATQKAAIDAFDGVVTKNIDMSVGSPSQATIIGAVDMYVSSFGNHSIVLHRHVRSSVILCLDPEYWAIAFLEQPFVESYAKTSDGDKRHMAAEFTLVCRNEKANSKVVACA
jgi:hypothetical protein